MNLLLFLAPCSATYYLANTSGGLNANRVFIVNRPREPYGSKRSYYNCNDECYCSDDADDSDDPRRNCAFCKPRSFNGGRRDPDNPDDDFLGGGPDDNGPGGVGGGPGSEDCCIQNEIDIDDLAFRLGDFQLMMQDDIDLIFSRISDRLDDFQSRISSLKNAYDNIDEDTA